MDKFLGAFSLQNFLRQFFCGVVFFVPFFLYGQTPLAAWLESGQDNPDWCAPKVAALGVLACIVGTIIYHFEKNLYSYGIQSVFEWMLKCKIIKCGAICLLVVVCIVCLALCTVESNNKSYMIVVSSNANFQLSLYSFKNAIVKFSIPVIVAPRENILFTCSLCKLKIVLAIIAAVIVLSVYFIGLTIRKSLHLRTRQLWVAEGISSSKANNDLIQTYLKNYDTRDENIPLSTIPLIAQRIAKWSDFIHCVQSCCFAWMSGCLLVMQCGVSFDKMYASLMFAVALLILEIFFDWHRYQHVLAITERNNKNT